MKVPILASWILFSTSVFADPRAVSRQAPQIPSSSILGAFDSSASLDSRIMLPPESVQQHYRALPNLSLKFHEPDKSERLEILNALDKLPTFARRALMEHVRSICFLDGTPANGTTEMEAGSALHPVFNMMLRAGLLHETVSEFLTRKENTYYFEDGSNVRLSIEAGSLPAVLYVLLHESVHVIDISNRFGKEGKPRVLPDGSTDLLVNEIWGNARTKIPSYASSLFQISWFGTGKRENIESAEATYRQLSKTPFVSLYGSSNWYDDIAELVSCYYLTQVLGQPYRIVLRRDNVTFYTLSPMNSPLVRQRFKTVLPLFA